MLITKQGYKRKYVIGGAGIFDSIANLLTKLFTSDIAKQITSTATNMGKEVGKRTMVDVGKHIAKKALTPKSKEIIKKYTKTENINNLIDGSGNAIAIQDLVKKLNGSGLKKI